MTLTRKSGLKRTGFLKRSGRIKPKKRSASSANRIYGPKAFRAWLHAQPCILCGVVGFTEQAHAKGDGIGRKADWTLSFPACGTRGTVEGCHPRSHRQGVQTFEHDAGVTLLDLAARTQAAWRECSIYHTGEIAP